MIRAALGIAAIAALISIAALCLSGVYYLATLNRMTAQLPFAADRAIAREMEATRALVDRRMAASEAAIERQAAAVRVDARAELARLRETAGAELTAARIQSLEMADRRLGEITASVEHVATLRDDLQPTINELNKMTPPLLYNTLGLIAASKVTAGSVAQMAREVRLATPEMIRTLDRIGQNSDRTTAATAEAMHNVAELTRPLPRWLRVPLQILSPMVPTIIAARR